MENVQEIIPGVFLFEDICNVYLIRAAEAAIAIDFGSGAVLSHLDRLGIERIEYVLHTHFHRDCCQGDALAIEQGAKVVVPASERRYFDEAERFWKTLPLSPYRAVHSDTRCLTRNVPVHASLEDGAVFRWRGVEILALETPGHTRGSLSYVAELNGVRIGFCGDLISAPGKIMSYHDLHWTYLTPIISQAADGSLKEMGMDQGFKPQIASLDRLLQQDLDLLLPSHGRPMDSPAAALVQLSENVKKVYDVLLRRTVHLREPVPQQILPSLIYLGNTSFGIIGPSRKLFLIDYSYGNGDMIERGRGQFRFREIDLAYPTHFHPDHAGFKELLDKESFPIWADERMVDVLENPRAYKLPGLNPDPVKVDRVLSEMEEFQWEGIRFVSFHFPCHTYYAAGLLADVDGKRVLFVGDNMSLVQGRNLQGSFVPASRISLRKGFIPSARKMLDLRPDVVIAAHARGAAYDVDERMLHSYYDWARRMEDAISDLADPPDCEWSIDPNWVFTYPYVADAVRGEPLPLWVGLTNHLSERAKADVSLVLPEGWSARPSSQATDVPAGATSTALFTLTPGRSSTTGRYVLPVSVEFAGKKWGQPAECIVELKK